MHRLVLAIATAAALLTPGLAQAAPRVHHDTHAHSAHKHVIAVGGANARSRHGGQHASAHKRHHKRMVPLRH